MTVFVEDGVKTDEDILSDENFSQDLLPKLMDYTNAGM